MLENDFTKNKLSSLKPIGIEKGDKGGRPKLLFNSEEDRIEYNRSYKREYMRRKYNADKDFRDYVKERNLKSYHNNKNNIDDNDSN